MSKSVGGVPLDFWEFLAIIKDHIVMNYVSYCVFSLFPGVFCMYLKKCHTFCHTIEPKLVLVCWFELSICSLYEFELK